MSVFRVIPTTDVCPVWLVDVAGFARYFLALGAMVILTACTASNMTDGLQSENNVPSANLQNYPSVQHYVDSKAGQISNASPFGQSINSTVKVEFPRIVGIPQTVSSMLASAIRKSTKTNTITIVDAGQAGATYQVNGSFNALDEGSGTLLIVHWQILDKTGRTLYRITEQQRTSARDTDPWQAINNQMIDGVVANSIKNMRVWIDYNS